MSTTIDWSAMTNQQRNALIAEHIMGQHLHESIPDYSGSMDAAMLIVQHLNTSVRFGYSPAAERYEPHVDHNYCEITLCDWPEFRSVQAYGKTLPEAICVAALREKGMHVINAFEALSAWQLTDEEGERHTFKTFKQAHTEYEQRVQRLKDNLRWAKDVRKLKIEEIHVPEDYWNGIEMA